MNRQDLQRLSRLRASEATVLLDGENFAGSYYLMGYAVECAIKSAIAKQTKRHDFPDKQLAADSYKHDLRSLMKTAGLWRAFEVEIHSNPARGDNWSVVKDWNEASRYMLSVSDAQARDLYSACTNKANGMLSWLKNCW
jgi:hypothetical protein